MALLIQSLILILSFAFVYIWQQTPMSDYTIQALGFLIFLYLITHTRKKGFKSFGDKGSIFILNTVILLLIFSTGGFMSSLFFLLYFLAFGITFVFEPAAVFVFILASLLIFLPDVIKDDVMGNIIRIGSLALISPLAFFFGKEYKEREQEEVQVQKSADKIAQDVDEVLKKDELKPEQVEKLDDILEETEELREETKRI